MKIYDFEGQKNISGDRIHQVRATKRISQADLAARMQVKGVFIEREAISKIETGDRFVTDYELDDLCRCPGRDDGLADRKRIKKS